MTSENYSSVIIKAKEGFYITEVDDSIDIQNRTIATAIALGTNDSADNYKEITADEADELKRLQDEARKEQIAAYRLESEQKEIVYLKSATIIQYTIKGRFMSR